MIWPNTPTIVDNKLTRPTFFHCGCSGITPRLISVIERTDILYRSIPQINPKTSRIAKEFLEANNYYKKIPILNAKKFGVLISPSGEWLDIMVNTTIKTAEQFTKIFKESK